MAENLIAVWLDLECASGNDARPTESEIRVGAKIMPYLVAGSDLICSGFGSILKYDNSFNPSLLNGEELEDFLVLQRDFEADGGLTPIGEDRAMALRDRALDALTRGARGARRWRGRPRRCGPSVAAASGSNDTESFTPGDAGRISEAIRARGITVLDVIRALADAAASARRRRTCSAMVRLRLSGDYLQTSALVRGGRVVSAVNDPNDYAGPGHRLPGERRAARRDHRHPRRPRRARGAALAGVFARPRRGARSTGGVGPRRAGRRQRGEVVVGLSPAFGTRLFRTPRRARRLRHAARGGRGHPRAAAASARVVRMHHTADTSFLGLSAARLCRARASASACRPRGRRSSTRPTACRTTTSSSSRTRRSPRSTHYRRLGANAAAYARGEDPEPVVVPTRGEAMGARFHAEVALIYAIETASAATGAEPEEIAVDFAEAMRHARGSPTIRWPRRGPRACGRGAASRCRRSRSTPCSPATVTMDDLRIDAERAPRRRRRSPAPPAARRWRATSSGGPTSSRCRRRW